MNNSKVFRGEYRLPGDKSISHRGAILASLCDGITEIEGYSKGEDCLATLECLKKMNVGMEWSGDEKVLKIKGKNGILDEPLDVLDAKNSGTTARLLLGVLSGHDFFSCITGDDSLRQRPMKRVINPLLQMGAKFFGRENTSKLPICSLGRTDGNIKNRFEMEVASAQVKSAIILSALMARVKIQLIEPAATRDHTERMLEAMGGEIKKDGNKITVVFPETLQSVGRMKVPADFSSAAFLMAAASIKEGSEIVLKDIGINPTRTGFLEVLRKMGAEININNERLNCNEPVADIEVKYMGELAPCTIDGDIVPNIIDELPLFAVLATQARGRSELKDAKELRYKETDRIMAITSELQKMGADITEKEDGFIVKGPTGLKGTEVESYNDHRIAMALTVAGQVAKGKTRIKNPRCVDISFPGFFDYFS